MRIALDIGPLARESWTGMERYLFLLATHLPDVLSSEDHLERFAISLGQQRRLRKVTARYWSDRERSRTRIIPLPASAIGARWMGWAAEMLLGIPDVLHTSEGPSYVPRRSALVANVFDLTPRLFSEHFPDSIRRRFEIYFEFVRRSAEIVITISESARRDVLEHLGIEAERVVVTPLAPDPRFQPLLDEEVTSAVRERYRVPKNYLIYIGTLGPRKNLPTLLHAYSLLPSDLRQSVGLVLCGKPTRIESHLRQVCQELRLQRLVTFTGYVPFDDLRHLLCCAKGCVLPSLYEGFGLPILEAMACGVPVVASNVSSIPEVAGDAALLFPPGDTAALARQLEALLTSTELQLGLRDRGLRRAGNFTWPSTARATVAAYRKARGLA